MRRRVWYHILLLILLSFVAYYSSTRICFNDHLDGKRLKINIDLTGKEHNISYDITNLCASVKNLAYFIYIYSAPENLLKRAIIRNTWGHKKLNEKLNGRIGFFLGRSSSTLVQKSILIEKGQYNDVVQMAFIDSYKNLTLKGVKILQWLSIHCSNAKYLVKVDDDVLVNIFALPITLEKKVGNTKRVIHCYVWYNARVVRSGNPKWIVSKKEFPRETYPTYCSGPSWVISRDLIKEMYRASQTVPFIPVEDVYTTGLLPEAIKDVTHVHGVTGIGSEIHYRGLSRYTNTNLTLTITSIPNQAVYFEAWKVMVSRSRISGKY